MEQKLHNLKMQILKEKGISDWLKKELAEQVFQIEQELAINYTHCCKSDSEQLLSLEDNKEDEYWDDYLNNQMSAD